MKRKPIALLISMLVLLVSLVGDTSIFTMAAPIDSYDIPELGSDFDGQVEDISSEADPVEVETVSENQIWNGIIDGEKDFSFMPRESGIYEFDTDYSMICDIFQIRVTRGDVMYNDVEVARNSTAYLEKDKQYTVSLHFHDNDLSYTPLKGNVSFVIKRCESISSISETEMDDTVYPEKLNGYYYECKKTGMHTFHMSGLTDGTNSTNSDGELYIFEMGDNGFNPKGSQIRFGALANRKFNLVEGKTYYIACFPFSVKGAKSVIVNIEKDDKDPIDISIMNIRYNGDYGPDRNGFFESGMEVFELMFEFDADFKVTYSDGSTEVIYVTKSSMTGTNIDNGYQIRIEYKGEYDDQHGMKGGLQQIVARVNEYESFGQINVRKKIDIGREYTIGSKISENYNGENDIWYVLQPSTSGFYWIRYWGSCLEDLYDEWWYDIYDDNDNKVDFVVGEGFRLVAGKKYAFHLHHGVPKSASNRTFTYAFEYNTEHNHKFGDWKTAKAASYTEEGISTRTCTSCGYEETKSIAKLIKPTEQQVVPAPTIPKSVALKKGKLSTVKNNKKKTVQVKWKSVSDASGYELQYALNKSFTKNKTKKVSGTKLSVKKLKKGKTYYFRVRAYTTSSGKKVYGAWSAAKKIKIKK